MTGLSFQSSIDPTHCAYSMADQIPCGHDDCNRFVRISDSADNMSATNVTFLTTRWEAWQRTDIEACTFQSGIATRSAHSD
eukprot:IDg4583t1